MAKGIRIKGPLEIALMRKAGKITADVLRAVVKLIKPGVTTKDLDEFAESFIRAAGAQPAFKGYRGYPATLCVSINDEVVHGIPKRERVIEDGDVVSVDVGVKYKGFFGDAAVTVIAGKPTSAEAERLLEVTRRALYLALEFAKPGYHVGDIGWVISGFIRENGFSVVEDFTGHGIGKLLHEDPPVPNVGVPKAGPPIRAGMTLAIEPMVSAGSGKVRIDSDGWTARVQDGAICAHFEHTIVVRRDGAEILTPWDDEAEHIKVWAARESEKWKRERDAFCHSGVQAS